jgi:cytochrome c553
MKLLKITTALLALASTTATALAFDFERKSFEQNFAEMNCAWCHGPSLQGFTTAPRLAGQKAAYIESQLLNFKTHTRDNPLSEQVMWGAAGTVSQEVAHELGAYLSTLDADAANDGKRELEERGRAIYQVGNAASNIPSCVVCHGPEAQGTGAIPRLGGLSYRYLQRRLGQWGEGYHASAVFPMPAVASQLSADDIDAIASYLSFIQ